jgi:OOP family OmpA-OmpF porin
MRVTTWAFVVALLLGASPALAHNGSRGDWELGAYAGKGWLDDYGPLLPKDDLLFGARLGYFITRHFGLEASAQRLPTDTRTLIPMNMDINSYRGNALLNFAVESPFRPFLTVGAGVDNTDIENYDNSTHFAWNAGGGFRVFMTPSLAFRADGRYARSHLDVIDEDAGNVEASAGLSLLFGGTPHQEEPEPPPPATPPAAVVETPPPPPPAPAPPPPPAPEAASCMAGGFPRNLSRLTNVDKACLDDYVQRLKSDPRAHAVVIGYADRSETSPSRIGEQRAGAVRDYLVQAGIESSRITTRSAADSNPVDTGMDATAQGHNRRVVVWFVPEGATEPSMGGQ